jgi:hypothetical protein
VLSYLEEDQTDLEELIDNQFTGQFFFNIKHVSRLNYGYQKSCSNWIRNYG